MILIKGTVIGTSTIVIIYQNIDEKEMSHCWGSHSEYVDRLLISNK